MYRWYWFRKLQLGETDVEEPAPGSEPAVEARREAASSRVVADRKRDADAMTGPTEAAA
jgi:hypothetical protein